MKILQINASYKPAYVYGGPTMSVSKLSEQLSNAGCRIEVYTTTANGNAELAVNPGKQILVDGVSVTYFRRITKDHTHFSPALLMTLWKEAKNFDVIHIHAWWNLVSVLSCWIAIKRQIPVVISPRGTLSHYSFTNRNNLLKKLIHLFVGKRLIRKSAIHVTSDREKKAIEALAHSKTIFNIPNFILLPENQLPGPRHADKPLMLLFFSRIEEKKGLDILLSALEKLAIPYQLTVAGDGDAAYVYALKKKAIKNGVSQHINWIGFQGPTKFEVLQKHDLMILPSYDENFGNVVIESLSVGTAVLISKNVGLADYVSDKGLGWVCDLNEESICDFIELISAKPERVAEIRREAPEIIRRDFDEDVLTKNYMEMYNQIIANG